METIESLTERVERLERIIAERSQRFVPPTGEEVTAYAASIGFTMDGEYFVNYYTARGWKIGLTAMKSWKAAVKTWKCRGALEQKTKGKSESDSIKLY